MALSHTVGRGREGAGVEIEERERGGRNERWENGSGRGGTNKRRRKGSERKG